MKTDIKNRIENLFNNYKTVVNAFLAEIKKWETDSVYSADFRQDKIRGIKANMKITDEDFNKQLRTIITEEKQTILNTTVKKPADYQQQISNALEFIKMAGNKLTDEQCFELIMPFIGDYQTMRYFQAALINLYTKDRLLVTCFTLGRFDRIATKLDNIAKTYHNFFNAGTYATNSLSFAISSDMVVRDAIEIESMINQLNEQTAVTFKKAEIDADNNIKEEMSVN